MPRMKRLARLALCVAVLASARAAHACSVCAAGDPLVAAADSASGAHELRVGLESEWLTGEALMEEPDMTMRERVEQGTLRVVGVYSPLADLNVVVAVPLVWKTSTATMPGMREVAERFGLGDVDLGARWFVVDRSDFSAMRHHAFALSAGTSVPTGANDLGEDGVRLDEHAQLGTGAFGPYAGALYRLEGSTWNAFASLTGRYRTENGAGYRYGPSAGWTVQGQRQLGQRFALGLGVDGRYAWADREDGGAVAHTGGLVLAAAPSAHLAVGGGVWVTFRAQVPFATRLRGVQEVGPTFTAGLQYRVF
jgi:hypothetical protein